MISDGLPSEAGAVFGWVDISVSGAEAGEAGLLGGVLGTVEKSVKTVESIQ